MTRTAALLLAAALGCPAQAQESLPAAVSAEAPGLTVRGTGTFRWLGLEIYTATLWTRGAPPDFDRPFVLTLRYARTIKGSAIAARSVEEIERLGIASPEQRRAWGAAMNSLFPEVSKGATLTGLNVPGKGARFFHDGRPLGEIAGTEFARAFFSIWLDPQSSAPALRSALMGEG